MNNDIKKKKEIDLHVTIVHVALVLLTTNWQIAVLRNWIIFPTVPHVEF